MSEKTQQPFSFLRDSWLLNAITMVFLLLCGSIIAEDAPDAQKSSAAITKMQGEMSKIKFAVIRDRGKEVDAELKSEPIFRYADPQRAFPDAALWIWTLGGRPVGFSKLERIGEDKTLSWQYCLTSANDERLAVRWSDGIVWKSRKAAFTFQSTDDKDAVQKTSSLRLVQLRNIARHFRASTTDRESNPEEMRLLAQPIYRYSSPESSVVDGAVFGLVSNGTNPDALLLIQVRQPEKESQPVWEYGCLALSGDKVSFELDGKTVFQHPGASGPGDHGHWLWLVLRD